MRKLTWLICMTLIATFNFGCRRTPFTSSVSTPPVASEKKSTTESADVPTCGTCALKNFLDGKTIRAVSIRGNGSGPQEKTFDVLQDPAKDPKNKCSGQDLSLRQFTFSGTGKDVTATDECGDVFKVEIYGELYTNHLRLIDSSEGGDGKSYLELGQVLIFNDDLISIKNSKGVIYTYKTVKP